MHHNLLSAKVVFFSQEAEIYNRIFGKLTLLYMSTKTKDMKNARQHATTKSKAAWETFSEKESHTALFIIYSAFHAWMILSMPYKEKPCRAINYFSANFLFTPSTSTTYTPSAGADTVPRPKATCLPSKE